MVRNILTVHLSKEAMICKGLQSIQYLQCLAMVLEPTLPTTSTQESVITTTAVEMLNYSSDAVKSVTDDIFTMATIDTSNTETEAAWAENETSTREDITESFSDEYNELSAEGEFPDSRPFVTLCPVLP